MKHLAHPETAGCNFVQNPGAVATGDTATHFRDLIPV
jgi:hypothetical protein